MKRILLSAIATIFFSGIFLSQNATDYAEMMNDPTKSFAEIQQAFNLAWSGRDWKAAKGKGYKPFKRWEAFHKNRLTANGFLSNPYLNYVEYQSYIGGKKATNSLAKQGGNSIMTAGNWNYIGPANGVPNFGGAGRITFIEFDPTNSTIVYAGSPGGGLWKSTTGGNNFTVMADQISALGCTDLVIDPTNTNVMYLATGDGDAHDTYSIGVLKTTDGGTTWNTTGLIYTVQSNTTISKLLMNPNNHLEIWAATSSGIMKTIDGGINWSLARSGSFKDLEFKPGNPNTVYAATGSSFLVTKNSGSSWTIVPLNFPTGIGRTAIAVTPADSNYVYVLAGNNSDYGFLGISKSTDGAQTFSIVCSSPNILGWWNGGSSDVGGQAWYDLAITASPTNKNHVITGGVNTWASYDGCATMALNTDFSVVHSDVHALEFLPGSNSTFYAGTDGGVFKTTTSGSSWTDVSSGLQIAQQYHLGVSQTNAALTLTGWQDNGSNLQNGSTADQVSGADGFECIISWASDQVMYTSIYYGDISKSTNGGGNFSGIVNTNGTGVNGKGDWNTPYIQHPTNSSTLLVGKDQVYRTTNAGTSWAAVGTIGANPALTSLAYSPSNPNYIYASNGSNLWVSTNGTSFTKRTTTLPGNVTYMTVDPANPTTMWITLSGYNSAYKVFVTTDAGVTWQNYSSGLPNVPCNTIVYQAGTNDGLYVGNDVGVFYRDSSMASWIAYSDGMPNVVVQELEIQVSTGKLRAATYGRGLWETDLYAAPTVAPAAAFSSNMIEACKNKFVDFYDQSTNLPYSWNWTFNGGNPATSTLQFPSVSYSTAGTYPVSLKVSNQAGTDSVTVNSYILINPSPAAFAGNDTTICKGDTITLHASGGSSYTWTSNTSLNNLYIPNPKAFPTATKTFNVSVGDTNGCKANDLINVTVLQPLTPTISQSGNNLTVTPNGGLYQVQWYYNGVALTGGTTGTILADSSGTYTASVKDSLSCYAAAVTPAYAFVGVKENAGIADWNFFPNPSKGIINVVVGNNYSGNIRVNIFSAEGKLVSGENKTVKNGETFQLKSELTPGFYFLEIRENNNKYLGTRRIIVVKE